MCRRKRHSAEQMVRKLQESELRLKTGQGIEQVCQSLEISEATFYRWRQKYGGMSAEEARRRADLEKENVRLKKLVADLMQDNRMLKDLAEGNF